MKIKDMKAGGWVRYSHDDVIELAKVQKFIYDKEFANGYCFYFEGHGYGLTFERKEFEYSNNVADLIKKKERVSKVNKYYYICDSFTKDEFVEKFGEK
nr:MAG TPA: hypothetical protein [Caudoviricetes sp.]